jgi:hypothetical protein
LNWFLGWRDVLHWINLCWDYIQDICVFLWVT